MRDNKIQKENLNIEIERKEVETSRATNQLKSWCKLFNCLDKPSLKTIENTRIRNRQAAIGITDKDRRKTLNDLREFRLRHTSSNKNIHIYY